MLGTLESGGPLPVSFPPVWLAQGGGGRGGRRCGLGRGGRWGLAGIVDGRHLYLGSANMDWLSLAQVKELPQAGPAIHPAPPCTSTGYGSPQLS